jgi:pimeloyl-ACP methyl ester carboxylesterase
MGAVRRLGLVRPVVFGHSYGTLVALAMALDHPGEVGALVLAGGYFFPTPRPDAAAFAPVGWPGLGDVLRYTASPHLMRAAAPGFIRGLFAPLPVAPRFAAEFPVPLALRPWTIRAVGQDTAGLVGAAARLSARAGALRLPVSIIAGEGDRVLSTRVHSVRLHQLLPDSRLLLVPGAGHMVHHAVPDTVAAEVERMASAAA